MASITKNLFGFLVIALCSLCWGCINENESCVPQGNLSLVFVYDRNSKGTDLFSEEVNSVHIHVFDELQNLVLAEEIPTAELFGGNIARFSLPPGSYSIAVWGNYDSDYYSYVYGNSPGDSRMQLVSDADGKVTARPCSLFHGEAEVEVKVGEQAYARVGMVKNTKFVRVKLTGVDPALSRSYPGSGLYVRVTGSNGLYDFRNRMLTSPMLEYIPEYNLPETGIVHADMTVMRLFIGDDTRLVVEDKANLIQTCIYEGSLTDILVEKIDHINNDDDLEIWDTFVLIFDLRLMPEGGYVVTDIRVDAWNNIDYPNGSI